jgi:hypothetical protein
VSQQNGMTGERWREVKDLQVMPRMFHVSRDRSGHGITYNIGRNVDKRVLRTGARKTWRVAK